MALNCSHRPTFLGRISEDNLISPMGIVNGCLVDGVSGNNGEGYSKPWHAYQGETEERNFKCGRDRVDICSSSESASWDIVDLLPSDPFGMDIKTTFTAITGWLEDLEFDYKGYINNNAGANQECHGLLAGWNLIWNNAINFQHFSSNVLFDEKLNMDTQSFPSNFQVYEKPCGSIHSFPSGIQFDEKLNVENYVNLNREERDMGVLLAQDDFAFLLAHNMRDIVGLSNGCASSNSELQFGGEVEGAVSCVKDDGAPHEALSFALSYLGVKDLLSVERVCRSFCFTVQGDPLLWMSIHIERPLNERITDDMLVQLASRAQGNLQCLCLVECLRITDDGLRRVLETNQQLTKLCIPGCTRLTTEGILNNVRLYNTNKDVLGIKYLRIGGVYGVTYEHFEELKSLLGADGCKLKNNHRPHFYSRKSFYLPCDDDRAIDIEMCLRCAKVRLVYDCPTEDCRNIKEDQATKACRACIFCIPRCAQCGRCINETEYEETFCLELLCSDCFKQLNKYEARLDTNVDSPREGALDEPNFSVHG